MSGAGVRVWVCGCGFAREGETVEMICKFANHSDVPEVGLMEYVVS